MEHFEILGWHWMLFGVALLIIDITLLNIYYLLWFGIGAFLTGLLALVAPEMPLWLQVTVFGSLSVALLVIWLVALKPRAAGAQLREAQTTMPGQAGVVVRYANGRGVLRLQRPIGGSDVWDFASDATVSPGARLVVSAVGDDGVLSVAAKENSPITDNTAA